MVKIHSIKPINTSAAITYFEKAIDFYHTMLICYQNQNWNSLGLTGVHCVISLSDALLAKYGKVRNTSSDHRVAAELLKQYVTDAEVDKQSSNFIRIIARKNLIEYESRCFNEKESIEIMKQVERFYNWASKLMNA